MTREEWIERIAEIEDFVPNIGTIKNILDDWKRDQEDRTSERLEEREDWGYRLGSGPE